MSQSCSAISDSALLYFPAWWCCGDISTEGFGFLSYTGQLTIVYTCNNHYYIDFALIY